MGDLFNIIMENKNLMLESIDRYITKAETKEADALKNDGFVMSKLTIQKQSDLEENITEALLSQRSDVLEILELAKKKRCSKEKLLEILGYYFERDMLALELEDLIASEFEELIPELSAEYIFFKIVT